QMPVFTIDGIYLVYVGAWKHHIGLYPIPKLPTDLEPDIAPYRTKTDTVRFLYNQPIPYELIERLIEALVPIRQAENSGRRNEGTR
ncbi:MAG: iron chaperone, partial [Aeromicrobium sp.]